MMKPALDKLRAGMVAPGFSISATPVPLPLTNCKIYYSRTNLRLGKASRHHWYFNESFLHPFFFFFLFAVVRKSRYSFLCSDFSFYDLQRQAPNLSRFLITPQIPCDAFHISSYSIIPDLKAFQL